MEPTVIESKPARSFTLPPAATRMWRDALALVRAREALASSAAALRSVDRTLDRVATQDWTATAVSKRMAASARGAREALRREANAVLDRLDHLPVSAVARAVTGSRTAVQRLGAALERGAARIAPDDPAGPKVVPPAKTVSAA